MNKASAMSAPKQPGVGKGRYYRKPKTASPILRAIFDEMWHQGVTVAGMADEMGRHTPRLTEWRNGRVEPGVMAVEEMAQHIGYRLALVPIESDEDQP